MSRAANESLDALHGAMADTLIEQLRRYRNGEVLNADGNSIPAPPALLAQVGRFLKDNGIDRPRADNNKTDELATELENFEEQIGEKVVDFPRYNQ